MTTSEPQHTDATWEPGPGRSAAGGGGSGGGGGGGGGGRDAREAAARNGRFHGASDVRLAEALCAHDTAALEEAFHRHAAQVANTVRRVGGGYYVDDVVHDVFVGLWRAPERFDPERGSLATYLVVAARGRTVDRVRSDGAWHRRNLEHRVERAPGDEGDEGDEIDDGDDLVLAAATAAKLKAALQALPMKERVAIELAFFGGSSYRQVAVQLGLPEGTIKGRISSGMRRLEAALDGINVREPH